VATIGLLTQPAAVPAQDQPWDLLITGGTIVDGTGAPGFGGDVAVRDGRIVVVSRWQLPAEHARRVIRATGLVVAPGFIDFHAHIEQLLQMPDAESAVRQGVTMAVGSPDGGGPVAVGEYLRRVDSVHPAINVAYFVGHNSVRREVMGLAGRAPTVAELERMKALVARAMGEGAIGLSTGLFYLPGTFAKTDEVIALARVAADSGGSYSSHLRNEGAGLLEGVAEALEIGRQARIPVVLSHHKAIGRSNWGMSVRTMAMIDSARAAGTDVAADQYPYTASSTGLDVLAPAWAREGGDNAFARRAANRVLRDSVLKGIVFMLDNDRGGGDLRRVQFASVDWKPDLEGRTLYDWALERGLPTTSAAAAPLVLEGILKGGASMVFHAMDEGDVRRIMGHPKTMIASDGGLNRPGAGHPHPRGYGTFPRVLGTYVRGLGVLTLEDAVRKMTSFPASRLGFADRGRVTEGMAADLTLFDPQRVGSPATFEAPHQYPAGIPFVIVNGTVVVDAGVMTGGRPGQALRRGRTGR
jgi:dihydroorotase/N-acyl-D-amino-acid deacylase